MTIVYQKYATVPLGRKRFIDAVVGEAIVMETAKRERVEKRVKYKKQ